ncbi:hypothetical protein [Ideonella sp. BN130291]|uniref:hypothetical protein n=1 Tax=Ideonella sp. BN130291 TaxID=3112940 RepID=UPI002E25BC58|nr:hypothetical protein [Ideonella sp. BN130291]
MQVVDALLELLVWAFSSLWVLAGLVLGMFASYFVWQAMSGMEDRAVVAAFVLVTFVVAGFIGEWLNEDLQRRKSGGQEPP